jgi:predicted nucleic acid-binding protein
MAVKIVDASAAAALLFGEPEGEGVAERLADGRLAAPRLFSFELANVCLFKIRRRPEERSGLLAAFRLRNRLGVEELEVDAAGVVELAEATGLTAYDASYLWLARQVGGELITLDRRLAKAAL